jgi:hypothetical protein
LVSLIILLTKSATGDGKGSAAQFPGFLDAEICHISAKAADLCVHPLEIRDSQVSGLARHPAAVLKAKSYCMSNPDVHAEGPIARSLEQQTAKLPSDLFLWAAAGSIIASLVLKVVDKRHDSMFVGQWAPTFLLLGIYNKLVKQHGSDHLGNRVAS